jgi:hypothetical protein
MIRRGKSDQQKWKERRLAGLKEGRSTGDKSIASQENTGKLKCQEKGCDMEQNNTRFLYFPLPNNVLLKYTLPDNKQRGQKYRSVSSSRSSIE